MWSTLNWTLLMCFSKNGRDPSYLQLALLFNKNLLCTNSKYLYNVLLFFGLTLWNLYDTTMSGIAQQANFADLRS